MFGGRRVLDPLEWVEGDGTRYSCPTVEATLGHVLLLAAIVFPIVRFWPSHWW